MTIPSGAVPDGLPTVAVKDADSDGFSNFVAAIAALIRSASGLTRPGIDSLQISERISVEVGRLTAGGLGNDGGGNQLPCPALANRNALGSAGRTRFELRVRVRERHLKLPMFT